MKTLILCNSLYGDIEQLSNLISTMEYEDNIYGQEIKDFNFIPQGIDEQFKNYLGHPVEVQPNTGVFRKPNSDVVLQPAYQHCLWVVIVALEDTVLKLYDKTEEDCSLTNQLNIKKNSFVFIRPWLWHSLEENKLVQVFLLNHKLENKEEDVGNNS